MIGIVAASISLMVMVIGFLSARDSQKREAIRVPVEVEVIRKHKRIN